MPEVDAQTGNYFIRQADDLFQSVNDRMRTPLGSRLLLRTYGFPSEWPTLETDAVLQAVGRAIAGDSLVDRFGATTDGATIDVDIDSVARLTW